MIKNFKTNKFIQITSILLLFIIIGCNNTQSKKNYTENGYTINATIDGLQDSLKVYLVELNQTRNGKILLIDSTFAKNNTFTFNGKVEKPKKAIIGFGNPKTKQFLPEHKIFWLDNSPILLNGDFNDMNNCDVDSNLNNIVSDVKYQVKNDMISECQKYYESEELIKYSDKIRINEIRAKYRNLRYNQWWNFVFDNPNNEMSIKAILNYKKGGMSKDSFNLFYERLKPRFKNSESGQKIQNYISYSRLNNGDQYIDIEAKDTDGNIIKLSDFKGKIILLEFWASWCKPCREFSKTVVQKLVKKYDNKDFVVVTYSLDTDKNSWLKTVKKDSMNWVNISNLGGVNDDAALKYDIQAIPDHYLISKNGLIVKSDKSLFEQIDELLELE